MDVRSASHPILNNTGAFREIRLSRFCRKGDGSWVMERGLGDGCNNTLSKRPPQRLFLRFPAATRAELAIRCA